ncbi:MAG: MBL fold metallo-hydrolase [Butyricicoccus sp.]
MKILTLVENSAGCTGCGAEHGLSLYIETEQHVLLMDTGASGLFADNARALGIDLTRVDTVVLSHGHYDHAGGLLTFAQQNPHAVIYLQDSAGGDFYHDERYIGIDKRILQLPQLRRVHGDCRIDEELSLFSGVDGRRLWPQSNRQLSQHIGDQIVQDTFAHEQCLVIREKGQSVLLSGCAHNGILNILDSYRKRYGSDPDVVVSGFHMQQKTPYSAQQVQDIQETARELSRMHTVFYSGHCTGAQAMAWMKPIMGDQLRELHSGEVVLSSN